MFHTEERVKLPVFRWIVRIYKFQFINPNDYVAADGVESIEEEAALVRISFACIH